MIYGKIEGNLTLVEHIFMCSESIRALQIFQLESQSDMIAQGNLIKMKRHEKTHYSVNLHLYFLDNDLKLNLGLL